MTIFVVCWLPLISQAATQPFPDASVGNYAFGVGSYYNAFAAGKLTINSSPIDTLEGRFAANQIVESTAGVYNDGKVWNKITSLSPVYVANEVPYDNSDSTLAAQGQNLFDVFNQQDKLPDADQVVINNLRHQADDVWTTSEKATNAVLIKHLAAANVGDVTYFKDNAASMIADYEQQTGKTITLDPTKVDASDYFKAAAAQIKSISDYYASYNVDNDVIKNDEVDAVTVKQSLSGTDPEVTVALADKYQDTFSTTPPIVFLKLSGQPRNVTIHVTNMDTTTSENVASSETTYATYKYAPYIFVNWTGVTGSNMPFTWGSAYTFTVKDTAGKEITNSQNDDVENSDGTKATINQLLSSHILNNFPNAVTTNGAYLSADEGSGDNLFTGTIMAPNASLQVSNYGSSQYFYGSVISGKDVLIENNMLPARVIASSFDVQHISTDNISDLDPAQQIPKLSKLTLSQGDSDSNEQSVSGGSTSDYAGQHSAGAVHLSATISPKKTDYQVFYQLNDGDWTAVTPADKDLTASTNTFDLGSLLKLTGANTTKLTATGKTVTQAADFDPTTVTTADQTISSVLARKNQLKIVVTPTTTDDGTTMTSKNLPDHLSDYAVTTVNIAENGTVAATIPTVTADQTVTLTNDWQVPLSLTLGMANLTTTLSDGALPLTTADSLHYAATIAGTTTNGTVNSTAETILPATSPPTISQTLAFKMTIDPDSLPATMKKGQKYGVPLNWQLNYGLTAGS
ncbi:hypothetical protein [Lactiplantibacillus daowaiensis]|uniref:Cell surface protein n=1 Tax=Lactiplantibacillus daowaiensis TaxID=2559918 RepID=A0ABW1S0X0_9LACO|nr:hypothetical protein [Lactiplantibacillus daowaiensis]